MKTTKKIACGILSVLTATSVLSGCGSGQQTPSTQQTSSAGQEESTALEPVDLIMYLIGDETADTKLVYDKVNEKLKEDINTTVTVKFTSWDTAQKIPLLLSSGEYFDCIYTSTTAEYVSSATKGAFQEITEEQIREYMPDYYPDIPKAFFEDVKIGGKAYMISYALQQVNNYKTVIIRDDLRIKYGLDELQSTDDYIEYLNVVAENEPNITPYGGTVSGLKNDFTNILYSQPNNLFFIDNGLMLFTVDLTDSEGTVSCALDDPAYLEYLKQMKTLSDNGVWSKSILQQQNIIPINEGKIATDVGHLGVMRVRYTEIGQIDGAQAKVYDITPDAMKAATPGANAGMAITAQCKNPERVMMMLNLFGSDQEYYDLLDCGIEGTHYELVDGQVKSLEQSKAYPFDGVCQWGWNNARLHRSLEGVPAIEKEWTAKWKEEERVYEGPYISFHFDDSAVRNQMALCNNIMSVQGNSLLAGLLEDPETEFETMKADLEAAGIRDIQNELQKQMTEFLASRS